MNYYKILRLNRLVKSNRLKILGVAALYIFRKPYLNVFLDPVLTCNFRCRMCYFSDPNYKPDKSRLDSQKINQIAESLFPYALKLQIGCGAEPCLFLHNEEIIAAAKKYKVPHISFTTNASLLDSDKIKSLVKSGLNEIIISMHGTQKEVYESMMPGAKFEKLHEVLNAISNLKKEYPDFKLRINYTVNPDNIDDLAKMDEYIKKYKIDILQIRPIRKLGNSSYSDFDLKKKQVEYSQIVNSLEIKCREFSVVSLITKKLPDTQLYITKPDVAKYTYCYVSPIYFGADNFNPANSNYREYLRKSKFLSSLLKDALFTRKRTIEASQNFGNYDVNI